MPKIRLPGSKSEDSTNPPPELPILGDDHSKWARDMAGTGEQLREGWRGAWNDAIGQVTRMGKRWDNPLVEIKRYLIGLNDPTADSTITYWEGEPDDESLPGMREHLTIILARKKAIESGVGGEKQKLTLRNMKGERGDILDNNIDSELK